MSDISKVLQGFKDLPDRAYVSATFWATDEGFTIGLDGGSKGEHATGLLDMTWEQWESLKQLVAEMQEQESIENPTTPRENLF